MRWKRPNLTLNPNPKQNLQVLVPASVPESLLLFRVKGPSKEGPHNGGDTRRPLLPGCCSFCCQTLREMKAGQASIYRPSYPASYLPLLLRWGRTNDTHVIPAFERLRQEDFNLEDNPGYIVRACLKTKQNWSWKIFFSPLLKCSWRIYFFLKHLGSWQSHLEMEFS